MATQAIEEYLEAIYHLRQIEHPVRSARLAERLKVSSAAVADMLARLDREGFVERTRDRGICLTAKGEQLATHQVSRHRLAERFLYDFLGLRWDRVHDEACKFEHVMSPETADGMERLLRNPKTCPHGNPIPDPDGVVVEAPSRPLGDLEPGESGVIAKITEEETALLGQLLSLGLLPAVAVHVVGKAPLNGPLLVRVGRSRYALGREVAAKIHVRMDGPGPEGQPAPPGGRRHRHRRTGDGIGVPPERSGGLPARGDLAPEPGDEEE